MTEIEVKLGYQAPIGLQIGGTIQIGFGDVDVPSGTDDYGSAGFGFHLGYMLPVGLKFSAIYYLSSAMVIDNFANEAYTGQGFKIGMGYSFRRQNLPWLAVNLNYLSNTYDEVDNDFTSGSVSLANDLETSAFILSVSFPFNFGGAR